MVLICNTILTWQRTVCSKLDNIGHYTPDMFVKSQWQRQPGTSIYYLIYRWVFAITFLSIEIASLVELGRPHGDLVHQLKWLIYLTHWGLTACVIQAVMAAYLVSKARYGLQDETEAMKMNCTLRIYWVIYNIAMVAAFCITAIYWNFVYVPSQLDVLDFLVHGVNSMLMLLDLLLVAHPVRLKDFYWPFLFAIIYLTFNYFYFLAGGTDRKGHVYIYKIVDWRKPLTTACIAQGCLLFVVVVHVAVCFFSALRSKCSRALRRRIQKTKDRSSNGECGGNVNEIPISDMA